MSTMTAILGRMATYSGKTITMADALASNERLALVDAYETLSDAAPVEPDDDGFYEVPVPGKAEVL